MKRPILLFAAFGLVLLVQAAMADWTAAKRLTWTLDGSWCPAMAVDGNDGIHVVWFDWTPGNGEIFYKRSLDGGATWSASKRLSWNSGTSRDPGIAVDSNDIIHVVWGDGTPGNAEIYYRCSKDGGVNWGATQRLTWNSGGSYDPVIAAASGNTLHLAWSDFTPGDEEIFTKKSTNGGVSWSPSKRLTWSANWSSYPALVVSSAGNPHVVYEEWGLAALPEVCHRGSPDGGDAWSAVQRLTWSSGGSFHPAVAVDPAEAVHVVWEDSASPGSDIYYRKGAAEGSTWDAVKRVTWSSGSSGLPGLALDSSLVLHLVWIDRTPENNEVFYKQSTDGGASWGVSRRLTWTSGSSLYPSLALDSDNTVHIVWNDDTPGNEEIYYLKGKS